MVVDGGNETAAKQDLTVKDKGGGCCCVKEREHNNYNIALELFSIK